MVSSILPLIVSSATVVRRGVRLLGPVDLTIKDRGITALIGPNGAGKTTLLRLLHGLERPRDGEVSWAAPLEEARMRQAFVFQTPIMMRRSVEDCIAYPLRLRGVSRDAARKAALIAAEGVGLSHVTGLPATSISGGEKQKLALARALIQKPEMMFLDEPCANLDGRSTRDIEAILKQARADGARIVMSAHDLAQARRLADEILFIVKGRIMEHRPAEQFFEDPETAEAKAFLDGGILD